MPFLDLQRPQKQTAPAARPVRFHGRVPNKESINFAAVGVRRVRWWLLLLTLVLIAAAAFAVGKFLVYDRYAQVSAAQNEAAAVCAQLNACNERIARYGELNDVYAHYTYSGMTEEELTRVDRVAVMDLLERVVLPRNDVRQWELTDNRLALSLEGDTLQEINVTVQALLDEPLVDYCEVNTATSDANAYRVIGADSDKVVANVVIYLTQSGEVTGQ